MNTSPKLRNKMLISLSLKEYLSLLENKFTQEIDKDPVKEEKNVEKYIELVEKSKNSVSKILVYD